MNKTKKISSRRIKKVEKDKRVKIRNKIIKRISQMLRVF
jgi:hypothetical protein